MRILVLSSLYPSLPLPGRGIFIENRIRHLAASGRAEVQVVCPVPWFPFAAARFGKYAAFARVPACGERHGIRVTYPRYPVIPKVGMTTQPVFMAAALRSAVEGIRADGFDFDLIDAYYCYPDGVAASLLGQHFDRPVILNALGTDLNVIPRYRLPRAMIRRAASHAAGATTVCASLKKRMVEIGVPEEKVRVVMHGVDAELFQLPPDREALRARLRLKRLTLLSVGSLIELKGHHLAIEALSALPEIELLIAGHGEEEGRLRALAAKLGVADRVRLLGQVDQALLPQYYGAADALVIASSREGIPNVSLEALACGTPVLATPVGGLPEVITEAAAGHLLEDRTAASLVSAVKHLFAQPLDRTATRRVAQRFSWSRTTHDHLAAIDAFLGSRLSTEGGRYSNEL